MTFEEIRISAIKYLIDAEKFRYSILFQKLETNEKNKIIDLIEALKRLLEVLTDDWNKQMYIKESCKIVMSKQ